MKRKIRRSATVLIALLSLLSGCSAGGEEGPVYYIPGWDFLYRIAIDSGPVFLIGWRTDEGWDTTFINAPSSSGVIPESVWYRQEHYNCPAEIMREILRTRPLSDDGTHAITYVWIVDSPAEMDGRRLVVYYDKTEYAGDYRELNRLLGLDE